MARTLTLQPATTDPFDTGWVGKIAGEVHESTSPLRRIIAHAKGVA